MQRDAGEADASRRADRISALVQGWLGAGASAQAIPAGDPLSPAPLYLDEAARIAQASPERRAQFALGRAAARRALLSLGVGESSIPSAPDGAPVWPDGFVGSITHCDGLGCAAVAPAALFRGVGLDIEPIVDLPDEVVSRVCRLEELGLHRASPAPQGAGWPLLTFSAKEAVYKCRYPTTRRFLDFTDVSLRFNQTGPAQGTFAAAFPGEARRKEEGAPDIEGWWFIADGVVGALAVWPARSAGLAA